MKLQLVRRNTGKATTRKGKGGMRGESKRGGGDESPRGACGKWESPRVESESRVEKNQTFLDVLTAVKRRSSSRLS